MNLNKCNRSSDYFDPTEFDTPYIEDNTNITTDGEPSEDGSGVDYTGCSDLQSKQLEQHRFAWWIRWYCPAVRSYAGTEL